LKRAIVVPFVWLALAAACSGNGGRRAVDAGGAAGVPSSGGDATTGSMKAGGTPGSGGVDSTSGGATARTAGTNSGGAMPSNGGTQSNGGVSNSGGTSDSGGSGGTSSNGGTPSSAGAPAGNGGDAVNGPVGTISGALATGVDFRDTDGAPVNAHGGGIIREGDTFYIHGEYFLATTTDNNFNGFSMYSSTDLATWKNEGIILPQQASGELGPNRKGERPHIIKCPGTGEFVLYAHAASADYQTDKEVVFATSTTVNGKYAYAGPLKNDSGQIAAHSDMSAYADESGAYVLTEGGHVYTLTKDCHGWVSDKSFSATNGDSGGGESPTVFKAGGTYYWIASYKTGWRANNNFYSTAPAITGPWTYQGFVAPVTDPTNDVSDQRTWLSQSTWVEPVVGGKGTVYVYWGDHWDGNLDTTAPGKHNSLATYVFQPLVLTGTKISMPTYLSSWKLDVGAGTWTN
jgi:hypothetical protein